MTARLLFFVVVEYKQGNRNTHITDFCANVIAHGRLLTVGEVWALLMTRSRIPVFKQILYITECGLQLPSEAPGKQWLRQRKEASRLHFEPGGDFGALCYRLAVPRYGDGQRT